MELEQQDQQQQQHHHMENNAQQIHLLQTEINRLQKQKQGSEVIHNKRILDLQGGRMTGLAYLHLTLSNLPSTLFPILITNYSHINHNTHLVVYSYPPPPSNSQHTFANNNTPSQTRPFNTGEVKRAMALSDDAISEQLRTDSENSHLKLELIQLRKKIVALTFS